MIGPEEDECEDEDEEEEEEFGLFDADELGLDPEEDDSYYA